MIKYKMKVKDRASILVWDKIDFKTKTVKRNKGGHFIVIKGLIQQGVITLLNIYAPKIGAPTCVSQIVTDLKGEIDSNTVVVGDSTTSLTSRDSSAR